MEGCEVSCQADGSRGTSPSALFRSLLPPRLGSLTRSLQGPHLVPEPQFPQEQTSAGTGMSPITEARVASSGPRAALKLQSENPRGQPAQEHVGRAAGGSRPSLLGPTWRPRPGSQAQACGHWTPQEPQGAGPSQSGGGGGCRGPEPGVRREPPTGEAGRCALSRVGSCGYGRAEQGIHTEQKTWALRSFVAGLQCLGDQEAQALTLGIWSHTVNSPAQLSRRASVSASVQWANPRTPACAEPG